MRITPTDKFWLVLRGSSRSELADVLCETDIHGLALMFRGGLLPSDIIIATDNSDAAHDRAVSELQRRGATRGTK